MKLEAWRLKIVMQDYSFPKFSQVIVHWGCKGWHLLFTREILFASEFSLEQNSAVLCKDEMLSWLCVCLCLIGKLLSPSEELPFSILANQLLLSCSYKPSVDASHSLTLPFMSTACLRHPCSHFWQLWRPHCQVYSLKKVWASTFPTWKSTVQVIILE